MGTDRKKRVLVTRSREQSSDIAALLEARGMEVVLVPTIAIAPPESYAALDAALGGLRSFDWLLFTSANAVAAFAERRGPARSSAGTPIPLPRIAAIGPATARALASAGMIADLIPPLAVAESLADALVPFAPGARMLLVRAETARDALPAILRRAGAVLVIAAAYRNVVPEDSVSLLRSIFARPAVWPDAITFSSSSTATNLVALLDGAGLVLPRDGEGDRTIVRASIGPITSQTLRDLGYPPHVEAREATVAALVDALSERLLP